MNTAFDVIGAEWSARAHQMAEWAGKRLVNRRDVWGQYTTPSAAEKARAGRAYQALTLPARSMRGRDMVTLDKLERHFGSGKRHHLVGLHASSAEQTCRWFAVDLDLHDADERLRDDVARRNYAAAIAWWERLQSQGYDPLLMDSNGRGGYHLMVLFAEPAPLPDVFAFASALVSDWEKQNLDFAPEIFPRSGRIEEGKLGAWLRLPGLHHTHDHYTRVWCGDEWLDEPWLSGDAAIDQFLATTPGPPPPAAEQPDRVQKSETTNTSNTSGTSSLSKTSISSGSSGSSAKSPRQRGAGKTVCLDLDGVLARYEGWKGADHIGDPIPGAVDFTRDLASRYRVVISTSRLRREVPDAGPDHASAAAGEAPAAEAAATVGFIAAWLDRHGFAYDEIDTGAGKPLASAYVDDRGVSCQPQEDGAEAFATALARIERLAGK